MVFFTDEDIASITHDQLSSHHPTDALQAITQHIVSRFPDHKQHLHTILYDVAHRGDVTLKLVLCPSLSRQSVLHDYIGTEHLLLEEWHISRLTSSQDYLTIMPHHWKDKLNSNDMNLLTLTLATLPLSTHEHVNQAKILYGESTEPLLTPSEMSTKELLVSHTPSSHELEDSLCKISIKYTPTLPALISQGKIIIELSGCSVPVTFCEHSEKDCLSPVPIIRISKFSEHKDNEQEVNITKTIQKTQKLSRSISPRLKYSSKPIPVPESNRNYISPSVLGMSPRFPARNRSRSAFSVNRSNIGDEDNKLSPSSYTNSIRSFAGSLQESLLSGHMARTKSSIFSGFSAIVSVSSSDPLKAMSPLKQVKIPFDTCYYHLEDFNKTPYVGSIYLPSERFRIAPAGTLQVTIANPSKTPIKLFVVSYDLSSMNANTKTFLRQITRNVEPPNVLQYAVQFTIVCSKSRRFYLYKNIRVVFPHRKPDDLNSLEVLTQTPVPQPFKLS